MARRADLLDDLRTAAYAAGKILSSRDLDSALQAANDDLDGAKRALGLAHEPEATALADSLAVMDPETIAAASASPATEEEQLLEIAEAKRRVRLHASALAPASAKFMVSGLIAMAHTRLCRPKGA